MRANAITLDTPSRNRPSETTLQRAVGWLPYVSFVGICARIAFVFVAATALVHAFLLEGSADLIGFDTFLNVDSEANLPTWFASFLAQAAAIVALAIARSDTPANRLGWFGIAFMLFAIGVDEVASIHNTSSRRLGEMIGIQNGWLMNAWVLPAMILCGGVAVCYLRFLTRIPKWMAMGFVAAATLYLIGAIGLEILGSRFEYQAGGLDYDGREHYSLTFELIAAGEEAFEYAGMLLTIGILIRRAREIGGSLTLSFAPNRPSDSRPQPQVWTPETQGKNPLS